MLPAFVNAKELRTMEKVLRASTAGFPCERSLWYSVNVEADCEPDERRQRIFDVGTCLEPLIVEWLRRDGWEVEYNAGSQSAPLELNIPLENVSMVVLA